MELFVPLYKVVSQVDSAKEGADSLEQTLPGLCVKYENRGVELG